MHGQLRHRFVGLTFGDLSLNAEQRIHDALLKKLADEGRIIEGGFQAMRIAVIPPNAPQAQVDEMRLAYMAGAQHLFSSILGILDPSGGEPTERDMVRMTLISNELDVFAQEMKARVG
jgi:hypothetical protein